MKPRSLKIKICGMKFAQNIAEIVELKPDFLGFIFYQRSQRFLGENPVPKDLKGIKKVGVFVESSQQEIEQKSKKHQLDYVQLHGNQSPIFCGDLRKKGMKIIKAFGIDAGFSFKSVENYLSRADYFLFDTKTHGYGGSGKKFPWKKLSEYNYSVPFFLSGGIAPEDAEALLGMAHPQLFGVDLNSCFEDRVGLKNLDKLKNFIQTVP